MLLAIHLLTQPFFVSGEPSKQVCEALPKPRLYMFPPTLRSGFCCANATELITAHAMKNATRFIGQYPSCRFNPDYLCAMTIPSEPSLYPEFPNDIDRKSTRLNSSHLV